MVPSIDAEIGRSFDLLLCRTAVRANAHLRLGVSVSESGEYGIEITPCTVLYEALTSFCGIGAECPQTYGEGRGLCESDILSCLNIVIGTIKVYLYCAKPTWMRGWTCSCGRVKSHVGEGTIVEGPWHEIIPLITVRELTHPSPPGLHVLEERVVEIRHCL